MPDLTFDLIARDRASRPVRDLGQAFDHTRRKLDDFNESGATASKQNDELGKSTKTLGDRFGGMGGKALTAAAGVGRFAAAGGAAASIVAPLAGALAHGAIAAAQFGAAVAPAAAGLLPLAAGIGLVTATFGGFTKEVEAKMPDVVLAFTKARTSAQDLAIKGIRPVAQEFLKANMPAISRSMNLIGTYTGQAADKFGDFINSAEGVAIIEKIAARTQNTFGRIADKVEVLGEALVRLAGRATDTAFSSFTDGAERALDKITKIVDGISGADVKNAFETLGRVASTAGRGLRMLGDGITWLDENREKLSKFADAMGAAAVVVGVATGGWMIALGAGLGLLVRHWDDVTDAVDRVRGAFSGLGGQTSAFKPTIDAFADAWGHVKDGLTGFVDTVAPRVEPFLDRLGDAFRDMQPAIAGWVEVLGPGIEVLLQLAGINFAATITAVGLVASAIGNISKIAARTVGLVLRSFADLVAPAADLARRVHLPFAGALTAFVNDSRTAAHRVQASLDAVDTAQAQDEIKDLRQKLNDPKLTRPERIKIEARIDQLRRQVAAAKRALNGIPDQYVNVFVTRRLSRGDGTDGGDVIRTSGARAAGGPVLAGRLYDVNERGRELFMPAVNGRILDAATTKALLSGSRPSASGAGQVALGGAGTVIHIGTIVLPDVKDGAALVAALQAYEKRNGKGWRA